MAKPKTLEQLRAAKEQIETQRAQEQHKLERLERKSIRAAIVTRMLNCFMRTAPLAAFYFGIGGASTRNHLRLHFNILLPC